MNILITGGAGYIGSHIIDMLIEDNNVILVDNLSTGHVEGVHKDATFYQGDICDFPFLCNVFEENDVDIVIHMAALISASESVIQPIEYYDVNTYGTLNLLKAMKKYCVNKIVFSSTAAVYGNPDVKVIDEECKTSPINPYGKSKLYAEEFIIDYAECSNMEYIIFRYFNVAGGKKPGCDLSHMSSLIPKILCSANEDHSLFINGNDYDTKDGTCVRDYIHILDLANAHVLASNALMNTSNISGIYNLGNGKGYTNLEVIKTAEFVLNKELAFEFTSRRDKDPVFSVASSEKSKNVLKWHPNFPELDKIILHMWDSNVKKEDADQNEK